MIRRKEYYFEKKGKVYTVVVKICQRLDTLSIFILLEFRYSEKLGAVFLLFIFLCNKKSTHNFFLDNLSPKRARTKLKYEM